MMNGNPHSPDYHQYLIEKGTREEIIEWLQWNDRNGDYDDASAAMQGLPPLTREEAVEILISQKDG